MLEMMNARHFCRKHIKFLLSSYSTNIAGMETGVATGTGRNLSRCR